MVRRMSRRTQSCSQKNQYPTYDRAAEAADRRGTQIGEYLEAYRCAWCQWFHIGHVWSKDKNREKEEWGCE